MALSREAHSRLRDLDLPSTAEVIEEVRDYMGRSDLSYHEVADRIGYARHTFNLFINGAYHRVSRSDLAIRAACVDYMRRYPLGPRVKGCRRLFETKNVRIMRGYFAAAIEQGEISLIYGPPGTQKSFVLEHLVAERNLAKKNDAIYVYASGDMTSLALLKRIGREAGVFIGGIHKERVIKNLIDAFSRKNPAPAVIIDEAQHLTIPSLEAVRELHDCAGCGVVLAGSHDLFEKFMKSRLQLEQWLSRIDHKEPLPGLFEDEVREISETELGRKLSEKEFRTILDACRVDDIFARGEDGRLAPRKYYSVRRLVKVLAQVKAAKKEKVA